MVTREQTVRAMSSTGAPVAKPFASVKKICQAGRIVMFDEDGSFIYNKANVLREEQGNYMLDVYVPPEDVANDPTFVRQVP